jgi:hypothetical protein
MARVVTPDPKPDTRPLGVPTVIPAPRERWETFMLPRTSDTFADLRTLNTLGAGGWEFVQVAGLEFWLKRRVG